MTGTPIGLDQVSAVLAPRLPVYAWRRPVYQTVMLEDLRRIWRGAHARMLDIGGGTGIIAQAVRDLFGVSRMISVDVENRFLPDLDVETATYDGLRLPFADGAFDAVMLNNVIHHIPTAARGPVLRESRRVAGDGPIYIKDHLARGRLDRLRLAALDWVGNAPFKGMLWAQYLEADDWSALAQQSGNRIGERIEDSPYRQGIAAVAFPNALEITMRWETAG